MILSGSVLVVFAALTGGHTVFCPEAPDQMAAVGEAAIGGDLGQRLIRGGQLQPGGLQLDLQTEGMDGVAGTVFEIPFQLAFAHMELLRQEGGSQILVILLFQYGDHLEDVAEAVGCADGFRTGLQIQAGLVENAGQQRCPLGHGAFQQRGEQPLQTEKPRIA